MESSSSVIVLDSDSDDGGASGREAKERKAKPSAITAPKSSAAVINENGKRSITAIAGTEEPSPVVRKRIKPVTIASNINNILPVGVPGNFAPITYSEDWEHDMKQYQKELAKQSTASTLPPATPSSSRSSTTNDDMDSNGQVAPVSSEKLEKSKTDKSGADTHSRNGEHVRDKNPIGKEFLQLLDACRKADPSKEMETLIEKKLLRYYKVVHPDYINSKSFIKAVTQVTADVLAHPTLVFLKLSSIVEELNVRRKSGILPPSQPPSTTGEDSAPVATDSPSSGNTKKDRQIAKLNRTLYLLTKRIKQLEEADVDFNHETNSAYLMAERYKKRAFDVYEKLCDITGENKNAHRLVRKPIRFDSTPYQEFNRTLQMFVNQTNTFPNFRDVLKCLQHCNAKVGYGLRPDQMNGIAEEAFCKIGRQLQKRRKTDLYETVVYHAGEEKDPALIDPNLKQKLEENVKHYNKVNQIIEKYAKHEHITEEELLTSANSEVKKMSDSEKATAKSSDTASQNAQSKPSSSHSDMNTSSTAATSASLPTTSGNSQVTGSPHTSEEVEHLTDTDDEEDDDDDDEDDDEEEDEFESTTKENVRPDNFEDIVISDDEELIVPES
uniref:Daxx histone-binding domain-containing protein n=1 Tax=Anopheles atroparvus TaxID=41427 RepID=A0A182JLH6_ANOAO